MRRLDREDEALIRKIAGRLYKTYCPMAESGYFSKEDVYHYGVIGFMDAKKRFDPGKQVPFAAYAAIRIQGTIMDALRKAPQIRLPQEKQARVKQLLAAKNTLAEQGKAPDPDLLLPLLGWDADQLLEAESLLVSVQSSDHRLGPVREPVSTRPDQEDRVLNKDLGRIMAKCLDGLDNPMERMILVARQLKGMTLKRLAEKCGCAMETVRQKELNAKAAMKECLQRHGWRIGGTP